MRVVLAATLLWALAWTLIGVVVALNDRSQFGLGVLTWGLVAARVKTWVVLGAITGALFAIGLMIVERSRPLGTLQTRRVAIWGAIAALVLPALVLAPDVIEIGVAVLAGSAMAILGMAAVLGAGSAALTLRFAQSQVCIPNEDRGRDIGRAAT